MGTALSISVIGVILTALVKLLMFKYLFHRAEKPQFITLIGIALLECPLSFIGLGILIVSYDEPAMLIVVLLFYFMGAILINLLLFKKKEGMFWDTICWNNIKYALPLAMVLPIVIVILSFIIAAPLYFMFEG
jgi:hypothetical protein